jgi:hypothetical protein
MTPGQKNKAVRSLVPCGRCVICMKQKRNAWSFRLNQELEIASSAHFITLTYNDENLNFAQNGLPEVSKNDFQLFMKRLRKRNPFPIRFYAVSEYGSRTKRPHYHMILFNYDNDQEKVYKDVTDAWNMGQIHIGEVNEATIQYCTKYVITRSSYPDGVAKPFALMSRKPGLGANYIETHKKYHEDPDKIYATNKGGIKQSLPRYYKDKLYGKQDKENYNEKMQSLSSKNLAEFQANFEKKYPEKNYHEYLTELKVQEIKRLEKSIKKIEKL